MVEKRHSKDFPDLVDLRRTSRCDVSMRILLAVVFSLVLGIPASPGGEEQGDLYLEGYLQFEAGKKFESAGENKKAIESYLKACEIMEGIRTNHPDWQPAVVKYRLGVIQGRILGLKETEEGDRD